MKRTLLTISEIGTRGFCASSTGQYKMSINITHSLQYKISLLLLLALFDYLPRINKEINLKYYNKLHFSETLRNVGWPQFSVCLVMTWPNFPLWQLCLSPCQKMTEVACYAGLRMTMVKLRNFASVFVFGWGDFLFIISWHWKIDFMMFCFIKYDFLFCWRSHSFWD